MKTSSILLILLAIFTFPLWIGLIGGIFGLTFGLLGGLFGGIMGIFGAIIGGIASIVTWPFHGFHGPHGFHFLSHPGVWMTGLILVAVIILSTNRKRKAN